jgi:hypothetical protein
LKITVIISEIIDDNSMQNQIEACVDENNGQPKYLLNNNICISDSKVKIHNFIIFSGCVFNYLQSRAKIY